MLTPAPAEVSAAFGATASTASSGASAAGTERPSPASDSSLIDGPRLIYSIVRVYLNGRRCAQRTTSVLWRHFCYGVTSVAGATGLEPATCGFGDRCSAN